MASQRISPVLALEVQAAGPVPAKLRELIREMAAANPIFGEARIADELRLKLGIRVSPRTVGKYLSNGSRPGRTPDPKQRWMTFVRNHAKGIVPAISSWS